MPRALILGACASALLALPHVAPAADDADIAALKAAVAQMREDYEARIGALERRLAAAEKKAAAAERQLTANRSAAAPPPPAPTVATSLPPATATASAAPAPAARPTSSAFNPAISLILEGTAASYGRDPEEWRLPGFATGGHAGPPAKGLSIGHTELVVSANVDDWFYGQVTLAVHDDEGTTEIDLEEAFVDTLSLPAGLGLRLGRFLPQVGYLNTHHPHAWDFVDAPLPNQAFLGGHWYDDGARLSWVAPTALYLELGIEALRGGQFPVKGDTDGLLGGAHNAYLKLGGDVGDSHSWQFGLSQLWAEPRERAAGDDHGHGHGHADESFVFSGDSRLTVADFVWKWAPDGEDGSVEFENEAGAAVLPYDGTQEGFYVQGVYQFMPRWRAGLRYDRIGADNDLRVANNDSGEADDDLLDESGLLDEGHRPHRWSAMVDYSHSEYSRLRLQYTRDWSLPEPDDQVFLQYVMSLGAHGAHAF
ncbi:MAG: TonB-dependent receptor [Gammaproteobacteria bacterium]|nr:TonB-dependent receptor [Gammaproteobacteria bacterium]